MTRRTVWGLILLAALVVIAGVIFRTRYRLLCVADLTEREKITIGQLILQGQAFNGMTRSHSGYFLVQGERSSIVVDNLERNLGYLPRELQPALKEHFPGVESPKVIRRAGNNRVIYWLQFEKWPRDHEAVVSCGQFNGPGGDFYQRLRIEKTDGRWVVAKVICETSF